jgi:hypothetical protein
MFARNWWLGVSTGVTFALILGFLIYAVTTDRNKVEATKSKAVAWCSQHGYNGVQLTGVTGTTPPATYRCVKDTTEPYQPIYVVVH